MGSHTIKLDDETELYVTMNLFKNVENRKELYEKFISGEMACCAIKASLIVDPFQVAVAANKAALNKKYDKLITKSLYTELLFCLSVSKNISASLAQFGVNADDRNILIIIFHKADGEESLLQTVLEQINGEHVPMEKLNELVDLNLVKKTYKIDNGELKTSNMVDSVVSRISCKDFTSMK